MEARSFRAVALTAALVCCTGATYRSNNFVVTTADPRLAEQFGKAAEKWRRELAVAWTGEEMRDWYRPCMMNVQVGPIGAGGATSFVFDRGEVYKWEMNIQGSAERILDSVLPHEITHMIFASYLRTPLPRWADEGGATTVECPSEQAKHRQMLLQFLRSGRGIAFNQMFAMTEYPQDVMPLYAQGHSLASYLIQQGGRRKYLTYLAEGMQTGNWTEATAHWYSVKDLGTLQNQWNDWVARGSPAIHSKEIEPGPPQPKTEAQVAAVAAANWPHPEAEYHVASDQKTHQDMAGRAVVATAAATVTAARETNLAPAAARAGIAEAGGTVSSAPVPTQVTRPQPIEHAQQIILEWGRQ